MLSTEGRIPHILCVIGSMYTCAIYDRMHVYPIYYRKYDTSDKRSDHVYPYDKVNDDDDKNHDDGMRLKIIILCQKRS